MISDQTAGRRSELVLYVVAAAILLAFNWLGGLSGSEDRWAEIAREMHLSGDWLHPAINGQVYFDKPHLSYWLIALAGYITCGINEFAVRLPSALAGLIALWGTVRLGTMMFDRRTGITAGWLMAGCYGFVFLGRSGEADMENMAAIILAVTWLYHCREKAGFLHYLLFYFICFAGALTKGLPSIIVPMAAAAVILLPGKLWLKHLKVGNILAFVLMFGLFLVPFVLAGTSAMPDYYTWPEQELSALELLWRENIVRAFAAFDHDEELFFVYVYELPGRLLAPWTLLFLAAIWCRFRDRLKLERSTITLAWIMAVIFLLFTLSQSRRWYYILPNVPFCALFIADFLNAERRERWERRLLELMRYAIVGAASLLILTLAVFPIIESRLDIDLPLLMYVGLPTGGALALGLNLLLEAPKRRARLAGVFGLPESSLGFIVGGAVIIGCIFGCLIPSLDSFRTTEKFICGELVPLADRTPSDQIILFLPEARGPLIYYMDRDRPMTLVRVHFDADKDDLPPGMTLEEAQRRVEADRAAAAREFRRLLEKHQGGRLMIVSDDRIVRKLGGELPPAGGCLDWEAPDYKESSFVHEKEGKRKLVAWVLDPVPVFKEEITNDGN